MKTLYTIFLMILLIITSSASFAESFGHKHKDGLHELPRGEIRHMLDDKAFNAHIDTMRSITQKADSKTDDRNSLRNLKQHTEELSQAISAMQVMMQAHEQAKAQTKLGEFSSNSQIQMLEIRLNMLQKLIESIAGEQLLIVKQFQHEQNL